MWVNKPVSDVEALQQAIQPFIQTYNITRNVVRSYNNRGRVDNLKQNSTVCAAIIPGSKQLNTQQQGQGRQATASYTIYVVVPEYISLGDLIHTPHWGTLKVQNLDDNRYQGMMSGTLVRTGTTESSCANDNRLYEPE